MNKKFDGIVASIQKDALAVVINKGSSSGVKEGMHYLIYNKGEEIMDPETNVSLGTLEIVCGKGVVTHVQENMATIKSSEKDTSVSKVIRPKFLRSFDPFMPETEERSVKTLPFDGAKKGSFARCLD